MTKRKKRGTAGDKTICLGIAEDIDYDSLVADRAAYRQYLDQQIEQHPELFPTEIRQGYRFHDLARSLRQGLKTCRIYIPSTQG